jgi:hypothetical protein
MDEIRRLEWEINSLQAQLRQQNSEAARVRQNLVDENRRSLRSYQADMNRAIRDHDSDMKAEFERLLSQYQRNLNSDVQLELAKMDADYSRLLDEVKRKEASLMGKNRELEQAITAIKNDVSRRNEGSSQEAKQYLLNATGTFHTVEKKPHEKFVPKRLQIFYTAIKDGQQLFKSGLFEAATAVAISAKSGLERLGYVIDDKIDEWDRQYDLFTIKVNYLKEKVNQELDDWLALTAKETSDAEDTQKSCFIEVNYWSRGEFAEIYQAVRVHHKTVKTIGEMGKEAYLKLPESAGIDELKYFIAEIDKLDERFLGMSPLHKQRYTASCERADWGESIIDFFTTEINLIWHDNLTGFQTATTDVQASKNYQDYVKLQYNDSNITEDSREWLKLVFTNASEDNLYIYILPIEEHSSVINHIVIHIDYGGPEQDQYSKDIFQHLCEAIQYSEDFTGSIQYTADINELKYSDNKVYSETGKDLEKIKRRATT